MTRVLIVRPQPGADATARRAMALGLDPFVAPLFVIEPVAWVPPDPDAFDALLLTSANAVRFAADVAKYATLPLFAVGGATAAAAAKAGFHVAETGTSGVGKVLVSMAEQGLMRVLHLTGRDHRPYPATSLHITTRVVYAAVATDAVLPDPPFVALLHSERAARRFSCLVQGAPEISIVAISADVLRAAGTGWAKAVGANTPDDTAMLALAARLCEEGAMPTTGAA